MTHQPPSGRRSITMSRSPGGNRLPKRRLRRHRRNQLIKIAPRLHPPGGLSDRACLPPGQETATYYGAEGGCMARISRTGTREQILSTALDLFLADGFEATSLRQIAEHLGITKAALWYHFPAKEQLVVELTRPFLNGIA